MYSVYRVNAASTASPVGFSLSGQATGLTLRNEDGSQPPSKPEHFRVRKTTAHLQSELQDLAEMPIEEPLAQGTTNMQLDRMVLGLQAGQPLALTGEREDLPGVTASEAVILDDVQHAGGYTMLFCTAPLQYSYVRGTVTVNANVAQATHGETVSEVLGSGDGATANQQFILKQPPLTYVSAATLSGSQSTLQVRVNGILDESPRLYGLDASSERYIVRTDDDGKSRVIFGDGAAGADCQADRRMSSHLSQRHRAAGHGRRRPAHAAADPPARHPERDESADGQRGRRSGKPRRRP